jgi:uncharacterized protein YcbX/GNAT superfamily N-acetyltransferase
MRAIRPAGLDDAPALARLSTQLGYPQSESEARRALQRIRTEASGEVLVATEGGEVVGWIHVLLAPRLESGTYAEIGGLVVDAASRGRGLGTRLVEAAEAWAGERGAPTIRVRSNVVREEAHRFYSSRGYDTIKTQAVFRKTLAGPSAAAAAVAASASMAAPVASPVRFSGVLARIVVFPVKSLDGVDVSLARILPSGALEHDRRFAIVDSVGKPVNGKRDARIHRIRSAFDPPTRRLSLRSNGSAPATVFSIDEDRDALEAWLGRFFGFPVSVREDAAGGFPDDRDAPGPTLVAEESLEEVAGWFPGTSAPALARRFRANLVVRGFPPFGDDRLVGTAEAPVLFRVGSVTFEGVNPCQRCAVPTRDPETGEGDPRFAKTFASRRRETLPEWAPRVRFDHFYRFTVNTRLANGESGGLLRVGDAVEIVS